MSANRRSATSCKSRDVWGSVSALCSKRAASPAFQLPDSESLAARSWANFDEPGLEHGEAGTICEAQNGVVSRAAWCIHQEFQGGTARLLCSITIVRRKDNAARMNIVILNAYRLIGQAN